MTKPDQPNEAQAYYNADFPRKLLRDYAYGNPRVEMAMAFLIAHLPMRIARVLDIGSGLGWTTSEIHRARPGAEILGLDLSARHVELATALFGREGVSFAVQDVASWEAVPDVRFDAVTMVDVYEHIPRTARTALHRRIRGLLAMDAAILLTFPSVSHQEYLRKEVPAELQPVDEDVTEADLQQLAEEVGGRLLLFRPVTVWRPDDYVHAVVAVGNPRLPSTRMPWHPLPAVKRCQHVMSTLALRPTRWGTLLPLAHGPTVVVAAPQPTAPSETAIRAQSERLPCKVRAIYGGVPDAMNEAGGLILPDTSRSLFWRLVRRLAGKDANWPGTRLGKAINLYWRTVQRVLGWPKTNWFDRELARYLRRIHADAVLAEYGPTGIVFIEACAIAQIPLIVHFHGYDSYEQNCLRQCATGYQRLFRSAAKIIGVSQQMCEQLKRLGAPADKLVLNPCGVDVNRFRVAAPAQAQPVFVAVGRFVEKKAPHLTILAFERVYRQEPGARLIMVGDGPLLGPCRLLVQSLGLSAAVELWGPRSHHEVEALMQRARCFVQHSVRAINGDCEGTPATVLEAGASGLPVVATRHAGIAEVIIDGQTGFLVEEGDLDGMADRMLRLAREPELAAQMGRKGRAHVVASYTTDQRIGILWDTIRNTLPETQREQVVGV